MYILFLFPRAMSQVTACGGPILNRRGKDEKGTGIRRRC